MTHLSPEAASLIAQASGGDDPSDLDEQRVRKQIAARLAAAAVAASAVTAAPAHALSAQAGSAQALSAQAGSASALAAQGATSAATVAGMSSVGLTSSVGLASTLSKLVLALALGGGGTALGVQYFSDTPQHFSSEPQHSANEPQRSANEPQYVENKPTEVAKIDAGSPSFRAQPAPAASPSEARRSAAPRATARPVTPRLATQASTPSKPVESASTPAATKQVSPSAAHSAVLEEASLLQRARSALASGQAAEAQKLLREHRERYPQGALVEERLATQILAECAKARTTHTDRRAAEFLNAYPRSPLVSSVRQACSENRKQNDSFTDLPPLGH